MLCLRFFYFYLRLYLVIHICKTLESLRCKISIANDCFTVIVLIMTNTELEPDKTPGSHCSQPRNILACNTP